LSSAAAEHSLDTDRALVGVSGIFLINGTIVGSLSGHFAAMQERLGLDAGQLSGVIICMAVGNVLALSFGRMPIRRYGSAPIAVLSGFGAGLLFVAPALSSSAALAAAALLVLGLLTGLMDIAMNVHAATVERIRGQLVMTRIHALYSVGGIVGAFTTGYALDYLSVTVHAAVLALLAVATVAFCATRLLPASADRGLGSGGLTLPGRPLLPIAVLAFLAMFCAAAMRDWSAVYLSNGLGTDYATAGLGFAAFSAATAFGRLFGDNFRERFGGRAMLGAGGILAALALAIGLWVHTPAAAIVALGMFGLAQSGFAPILFSAAGRSPTGNPADNISAVMTIGFLGYIASPPLIGLIADGSGLSAGLLSAAVASAVISAVALAMSRKTVM
jgi:predicted MFS family arabinose efflux permease